MEIVTLAENLLFTTVRIETESEKGNRASGTGFIFEHTINDLQYPFIVTNKHVVADSKKGKIYFIRGEGDKPKIGSAHQLNIDDFTDIWHGHPEDDVDVTVTPLVPLLEPIKKKGVEIFYRSLSPQFIPTPDQIKELDALEDIIFVGYPNGLWDEVNFTPIMRRGITATPLALDYEGKKKFLIDASVFGGSSGSPVFVYQSGAYATKGGATKIGTKFFFVGIVASVYYKTDANEIIVAPAPTQQNFVAIDKEMIDLGVVLKAETVVATFEAAVAKIGVKQNPD